MLRDGLMALTFGEASNETRGADRVWQRLRE
jgi:hypothetical protein